MKRIGEVSTPGTYLHIQNDSLTITRDREVVGRVPLEDLGTLILACPAQTVTSALLARLADLGGIVIVAGSDHQPEGALVPLRSHSTRSERIRAQVRAKRPLEKRIWTSLVQAKIRNQAALLSDVPGKKHLLRLADDVRSGDPKNLEGQAARVYWPLVFYDCEQAFRTTPFRRRRDGVWPNNLLNYGYAILRAITARAICGAGLLPEIGLHHHNRYDAFALASDLMEPFRPWVDECCQGLTTEGPRELDRLAKASLLGIYDAPVDLSGETTPLFVAIERAASSLAQIFLAGQEGTSVKEIVTQLRLPILLADCES